MFKWTVLVWLTALILGFTCLMLQTGCGQNDGMMSPEAPIAQEIPSPTPHPAAPAVAPAPPQTCYIVDTQAPPSPTPSASQEPAPTASSVPTPPPSATPEPCPDNGKGECKGKGNTKDRYQIVCYPTGGW